MEKKKLLGKKNKNHRSFETKIILQTLHVRGCTAAILSEKISSIRKYVLAISVNEISEMEDSLCIDSFYIILCSFCPYIYHLGTHLGKINQYILKFRILDILPLRHFEIILD